MAHITIFVSGSIAAYKAVYLMRSLQKNGHHVKVAMTKAATKFVGTETFSSLLHEPVLTDLFDHNDGHIAHIEFADWTQLAIVAPASADIIAKMANGIADDAVTSTLLAVHAPTIVVPAMNSHMWEKSATQRNLRLLKSDGYLIMDPVDGQLAEGYAGKGRFPEPELIKEFVEGQLGNHGLLAGKKIVVTAGGTLEYLDPVRFIGNRSSGKMGVAVAQAALSMGAQVTLIAGTMSVAVPSNPHLQIISVKTTEEMLTKVNEQFTDCDALIMAAAIADFKPLHLADQKIKKHPGENEWTLKLETTPDILATMGAKKQSQLVVGFAAETQDLLNNAEHKLASKHADMIVANDVAKACSGFGTDTNQVTILQPGEKPQAWPLMSKAKVAQRLMKLVAQKLGK
ncbi:MAG TPA: bifunctional phosphopantothenoylcysteine decarboxylase/phosphopantothenate--cysteine ligase CoaBC [Candidatus Limosilactobacillus merdigallinarum]|uniref:Coenzyme A biosynthesis bifunctional protein CoaBC n=1 Tax=Candidatus Limosilactobacillus merdigallinarum TaxID=2838652 RepID=A0A9D1VGV3_9LACO|nr:bifunctional phosphopantothenoylcysteine decarboxylase/phosphopantothenate--cysteine ligase CoaBC [Candidatus Limosilactobacillus merdigallinarum]